MKVLKLLLFIAILQTIISSIEGASLKLVKEIGSDDDNYIFMRIFGSVLSKKKDIYVLDVKGNFLARYDWNGNFLKKVGQRGQGPGDFNGPGYLNLFGDKLYFSDMGNNRIAEVDLELKEIKYHRIYDGIPFNGSFFIIGKSICVGNTIYLQSIDEYRAIRILDFKTQWSKMFFEHVPNPNLENSKKLERSPMALFYSTPCFGIDRKNKKMVISFNYPNNPIVFFVYSFDGECIERFSYNLDENYRPPDYIIRGQRPSKKYTKIMVNSIFAYNGYYLVLISKTDVKNYTNFESKRYFLVFDENSKEMKHKFSVPDYLEAFSISEDGYLLGTRHFEISPKLCIYQLEIQ